VIAALVKLICVPVAFTVTPAGGALGSKRTPGIFHGGGAPFAVTAPVSQKYNCFTPRKFVPLITSKPLVAL
jgi:hypothetical protein